VNSQLAVGVTLLVASVSGFAIWQEDARGAARPVPVIALDAPPAAAPPARPVDAPASPSLSQVMRRWLDGELTIELRRGTHSLTLQVSWREREPVAAADAR